MGVNGGPGGFLRLSRKSTKKAMWNGIPPHTAMPMYYVTGTAIGVANRCLYSRVIGGYKEGCTKIRLWISVNVGNMDVAVYSDNDGTPGTKLASTGSIANPGSGVQLVTLDTAVDIYPGMWIALSTDSTTAAFGRVASPGVAGGLMGSGFQLAEDSAFPCPATPNPAVTWAASYILIGV